MLGALGIGLGLGLRDTLIVLIAGNVVGTALFGVFVVMGQQTDVTGRVLSRAAFGRRGAYAPAVIQATLGPRTRRQECLADVVGNPVP